MAYSRNYRRPAPVRTADGKLPLVTPRQMAALDRMASANGFTSGDALLCDVASCSSAELDRKPRKVVQMFVDHAFARYGKPAARRGRCTHEDYPCCGCGE